MTPRRMGQLSLAGVALVSGTYVFVYIVRWEWGRATISALLFVAAELLLLGSVLLGRLGRLEARLDRAADPRVLARLQESRPPPRVRFAWLAPEDGRMPVLVPVLMGAGVVLGGLAFLVERLARATATPLAEHGLAQQLSALALPAGGLLPPLGGERPPPPTRRRPLRAAVAALVVAALLGSLVVALSERLKTRPDADPPAATVVELTVDGRRTADTPEQIVQALWSSCRASAPYGTLAIAEIVDADAGRARITLTPGLGTFASRRLHGCLGDLRLERFLATEVSVLPLDEDG